MSSEVEIRAPAEQTEGTRSQILRWLKSVGESVAENEPLIELETDKVTVEVPSPGSGTLREILKQEQDEIGPGDLLGLIEAAGAGAAADSAVAPTSGSVTFAARAAGNGNGGSSTTVGATQGANADAQVAGPASHNLSPAVRRLLSERGLEASQVRGTGQGGRVTVADVLAHGAGSLAPGQHPSADATADVGGGSAGRPSANGAAPAAVATNGASVAGQTHANGAAPGAQAHAPGAGAAVQTHGAGASPAVQTHGVGASAALQTHAAGASAVVQTHAAGASAVVQTHAATDVTGGSRRVPHTATRKRIAEHMVQSLLHTAPHVTTVFEADLTAVLEHRQRNKEDFARRGAPLTFTAYFLQATVAALRAVPEANSRWTDSALEVFDSMHIGVATALETGLVVPVLRDVQSLDLFETAKGLDDLVSRARDGHLTPADVRGGTFTISNHGVSGSLVATPIIINQPQSAILGVGKLEKRPVVMSSADGEDRIVIRPRCYVTLTIDHRVMDGHQANRFLQTFVERLATPE